MLANVIAERAGWLSDLIARWRNQSASFGDPGRGIGCYLQIWALLRGLRVQPFCWEHERPLRSKPQLWAGSARINIPLDRPMPSFAGPVI